MILLPTQHELVVKTLQALGIQTDHLKEITIHISPNEAITADCVYYVTEPPLFSVEEIETICKKMQLKFEEI
jgi:hypothetical protein